ncbi:MAG: hypothetical protein NTY88_04575 [Bacteroidetes bacterium]|nr:hypothetical protein [Bacteroidota bacterium]
MKRTLSVFLCLFIFSFLEAQNSFEGTLNVLYTNDKSETVLCEIKIKGDDVYLKQVQNGNAKYDRFVINLKSRELYTVSAHDKKITIKYQLDSLLNFYDRNNLKEGFSLNPKFNFKISDKAKTDEGISMAKYIGENETQKAVAWIGESTAPVNSLIPFLKLLGNWNETDGSFKNQIFETEVSNKANKKNSKVKVSITKEPVAKEMFVLPKTYLLKDFAKLMIEERDNKNLKMIIQAFAQF